MMKAGKGAVLSFIILILSAGLSRAQVPELINDPQFRITAQAAVDSIYNFNFEGSEQLLRPWKEKYPDHPLWLLIEGMALWWEVLSDLNDTSHDEQFFYLMKRADYESSKLLRKNSSHADGLIIKAVSNGYVARHYANREEWLSSLNQARRALSAHEHLSRLQPGLADLKLAEGLKLYYSAYLPEAYPIVKTVSWFLPDGDKAKGMALLAEASNEAIFARAEAAYFLGNINYNYEKNYEVAARYFEELYRTYPRNNYYVRLLVKSYYRMKRYDEALAIINDSMERWEKHDLPYQKVVSEELLTWKGRILTRKFQFEKAMDSYREAFALGEMLPRTDYRPFHAISGYYLGRLYCENNNYPEAEKYFKSVTSSRAGAGYKSLAEQTLTRCRGN